MPDVIYQQYADADLQGRRLLICTELAQVDEGVETHLYPGNKPTYPSAKKTRGCPIHRGKAVTRIRDE